MASKRTSGPLKKRQLEKRLGGKYGYNAARAMKKSREKMKKRHKERGGAKRAKRISQHEPIKGLGKGRQKFVAAKTAKEKQYTVVKSAAGRGKEAAGFNVSEETRKYAAALEKKNLAEYAARPDVQAMVQKESQSVMEKFLGGRDIQDIPEEEQQTFSQKIAEIGLKPAEYIAQKFGAVIGEEVDYTAKELSKTYIGEKLGFATAALGAVAAALMPMTLTTIGKAGTIGGTGKIGAGVTGQYAINPVTAAKTTSWLIKFGAGLATGALVAAIGSYPFAGFIKEEALQTLSFGTHTAINNGDVEGAERALSYQEQLLNPSLWGKIVENVPFANVVRSLKDFYQAAKIKLSIDSQMVSDMRIQQETGETEEEKWARIRQQEMDDDKKMVDYWNSQRKLQVEWEAEARRMEMIETAEFWKNYRIQMFELEAEERRRAAEFWRKYREEAARMKEEASPSKLNFGLL